MLRVYTPVYCIALFLPTIVATLGYTNTSAQLMSAPPYVVACGFCILGGWAADRVQSRGIFMVGFQCVALVGIILQIAAKQDRAKYAGTYLLTIGLYPCVPMGTAWNSNNIGGSAKRAVGIAMQIAAGTYHAKGRHFTANGDQEISVALRPDSSTSRRMAQDISRATPSCWA